MDLLNYYLANHDLTGLRELWGYLDSRLFCRLEQIYAASVRKLEVSLHKMYLVSCVQNNKHDKVTEFFEKLTPEIQNQYEWREWFGKFYTNSIYFVTL